MNPKTRTASGTGVKKKKQHPPAVKFILAVTKILLVFFVVLSCAVAGIVGGAILGYIKTSVPIKADDLDFQKRTSFVYDYKGNEIAQLKGTENRVVLDHDEIPDYLRDAFVAIEDARFYSHKGVDIRRTLSAGLSFVLNFGDAEHGGSTITQQLVRGIMGTYERSLARKVQEQWNAIQLEKKLTKKQILDAYMNLIYMGGDCYGVESASQRYFNKPAKDLSLAECASLAGITNLPDIYMPTTPKRQENNIRRQKIILSEMLKQGKISKPEYDQALTQKLTFADPNAAITKSTRVQSYFIDQVVNDVINDLMEQKGWSKELASITVYNRGLKIYTTQDSNIQKAMDEVFTDDKYFPKIKGRTDHSQAAMVIIDPSKGTSGEVRALYGGYGEKKANLILNRASSSLMKRQPGSSFKPIADYAPAIDSGMVTSATIVDDVPVYMNTQAPTKRYPTNYESGTYRGLINIHDAIVHSQNVVAAKIWKDIIGPDLSIQYLKKAGIDRSKERYVSMALGGLNEGVNPLQMAAAYVPFVNKGMYYQPITYTKVEDKNGNVLIDKKPLQKKNITYMETTAFIMEQMMQDVCKRGTASKYGLIKNSKGETIATAGKTGTSSDFIDKWFVGYTPYYVGATWFGYDNDNGKRIKLSPAEYNQALAIWYAVMNKAHKDAKPASFVQPEGIVKKAVCIYSGKTPTDLCSKDPRGNAVRDEYFIKGTEPKPEDTCDVHYSSKFCKDSKDIYGRYLLFGPNCPASSLVERVYIQRPEPYTPLYPGEPLPEDFKYGAPAAEYCTVHGGYKAETGHNTSSEEIPKETQPVGDESPPPVAEISESQDTIEASPNADTVNQSEVNTVN